jgi:hypothetical protein
MPRLRTRACIGTVGLQPVSRVTSIPFGAMGYPCKDILEVGPTVSLQ